MILNGKRNLNECDVYSSVKIGTLGIINNGDALDESFIDIKRFLPIDQYNKLMECISKDFYENKKSFYIMYLLNSKIEGKLVRIFYIDTNCDFIFHENGINQIEIFYNGAIDYRRDGFVSYYYAK